MLRFQNFDEVFQALKAHFRAETARTVQAVVGVHIEGEGGGSWYLDFDSGRLDIRRETPDKPVNVDVFVRAEDYWALLYGELDPMAAYMRGRLRIRGDLRLLYQLQHLFRLPGSSSS